LENGQGENGGRCRKVEKVPPYAYQGAREKGKERRGGLNHYSHQDHEWKKKIKERPGAL